MKEATVNSKFFAWHPYARMDAGFWTEVMRIAERYGIDTNNELAMRKHIIDMEKHFVNRNPE